MAEAKPHPDECPRGRSCVPLLPSAGRPAGQFSVGRRGATSYLGLFLSNYNMQTNSHQEAKSRGRAGPSFALFSSLRLSAWSQPLRVGGEAVGCRPVSRSGKQPQHLRSLQRDQSPLSDVLAALWLPWESGPLVRGPSPPGNHAEQETE